MSARDPILSSSSRQSELAADSSVLLSSLEYPLCLRSLNGDFVYSNMKFSECIKGFEYSISEWFERLPVETRCQMLSCELDALSSPNLATFMNLNVERIYQFSVLFNNVVVNKTMYISWSFFDKLIFKENNSYFRLGTKIKSLDKRNPAVILEPAYYKVFCLYFSGFTHDFISSLLKINVGTSKNRVSKAYSLIGIIGRDEMVLYLKTNSYFESVLDYAFHLISCNNESDILKALKRDVD